MRRRPELRLSVVRLGGQTRSSKHATDVFGAPLSFNRSPADERPRILRGMVSPADGQPPQDVLHRAARSATATPRFRARASARSGRRRSTPPAIRLRRGESYRAADGWRGDVVAPMIRDLGVDAWRCGPAAGDGPHGRCRRRWARPGPPMDGKDLHIGDFDCGLLPATAPLASGALTIAGMAMAFAREGSGASRSR